MERPELVRSWASDALSLFEPDYVWHDLAQTWQTPGDGEASLDEMFAGTPAERAERLQAFGIGRPEALQIAGVQGEEMKQAILALYRSAAQPAMAELGKGLSALASRPGLALVATADPFGGVRGAPSTSGGARRRRGRGARRAGPLVDGRGPGPQRSRPHRLLALAGLERVGHGG